MTADRKPKLFYGYVVVAAGFIGAGLIWGTYRSYGLFFKPLSSELGWTSAEISGAFSLAFLLFGFGSIVAGRLSDKWGPKVVFIACGLFMGLGYLLMSQVNSIWQLYLFYGAIVGIGMSGIDAPALSTVARWFVRKRGMAIGITKAGTGVGMFIIPLLVGWLISGYGWRNACVVIAIICLVGIVSAAMFLRRDPGQIEQLPDGTDELKDANLHYESRQFSLREASNTSQFWIYSAIWFIVGFCTQVIMVHIAPHVIELGISVATAATILSMIGATSVLGRITIGSVSDRMGYKSVFIVALSLLIVSLAWVQYAQEAWMFYLLAVLYGIAHGAIYTLSSPILAELFGLKSLGAIIGTVVFIGTIGGSIGPVLSGNIFDITGSYRLSFLICLALSIVALILMLFLRPTRE